MSSIALRRSQISEYQQLIINELLFWLHAAIILAGVLMGLVLPWFVAISLVILHRIHLRVFDGCVISQWQKKSADLSEQENYLQQMCQRLFGVKINLSHASKLDHALVIASLAVTASAVVNSALIWSGAIICLCGFAIFTCFRILEHKRSKEVSNICNENACTNVMNSQFNSLGGVRLEVLGLLFFLAIVAIEIFSYIPAFASILNLKLAMVSIGLCLSVLFVWVQFSLLKNICKLCMNVHAVTISVFVLTIIS